LSVYPHDRLNELIRSTTQEKAQQYDTDEDHVEVTIE